MIKIEQKAYEKSTICLYVTLLDIDKTAVTPKTMLWTLVDKNDDIMNAREQVTVPVGNLGAVQDSEGRVSTRIVLSGDDLLITEAEETNNTVSRDGALRRLVIEATYDGTCGNDLPVTGAGEFVVINLPYIRLMVP